MFVDGMRCGLEVGTNAWLAHIWKQEGQIVSTPLQVPKRWSDRFKEIEEPLFPGYVFASSLTESVANPFDPWGCSCGGCWSNSSPVDESEITAIQTAVTYGLPSQPWPFLRVGHR